MEQLQTKSPTRIDLAGGFLDIWPVYALFRDCCVVNSSIPVFTSVCFQLKKTNQIHVQIQWPSGFYKKSFINLKNFLDASDGELALLKEHVRYWHSSGNYFKNGFSIKLHSESPIGAGLGGSSSLSVSLLKAFSSFTGKSLSLRDMVLLCRDLESVVLHKPAGIQDYIPALKQKIYTCYIIHLSAVGPEWSEKEIPGDFFKNHVMLLDMGQPHHSGNMNWSIFKKVMEKDKDILSGLSQLRDNALKMAERCETEDWLEWFPLIQKEYEFRSRLFPGWLTPSISSVSRLLLDEGAQSLKLCGAGGGGCLMVMTKNLKSKKHLEQICMKNQIPVVSI